MATSFSINQNRAGDLVALVLKGDIFEGSDYSAVQVKDNDKVTIDFSGIALINSTGIQKWIKFLDSLPKSIAITFENCPIRVINQINLFPGFLGGRTIAIGHFDAPYFCPKCDDSRNVSLVNGKDVNAETTEAPPRPCPSCQSPMEFDSIPKKYFLFLKR